MVKRLLLPLIFSFILVLPAYTTIAPGQAPDAGNEKTSSSPGPPEQVIVIRTAKDPKVKDTKVGKDGEIIIPQSAASASPTVSPQPNPSAAAQPHRPTPAAEAREAEERQDKLKDARDSKLAATPGVGTDRGTTGFGDNGTTGNAASSPAGFSGDPFAGGVPFWFNTSPSLPPVPPTLPTTQLQALLNGSVSDAGVPGAIMAVQTRWGTWIGAAGKANLPDSLPMTTDMQVRLAGGTKLFTAALIMKLVEENKISLADTVEKWLPGALAAGGDQITVSMLLNHTSGLHDHETTQEFLDQLFSAPTVPWTSAQVLAITNSYPLDFTPGTKFSYCHTGYYLLGMIAEAATGDTVENLIQLRFFNPWGLSRTALTRSGLKTAPYGLDYCWFGVSPYLNLTETSDWDLSYDWTSGSGVSTAQNMLTWIKALFSGLVVTRQSLAEMITPKTPATTYGFGLEVTPSDPWFKEPLYFHSGAGPGFYSRWLYYPNSGRLIFIALNRHDKRFLTPEPPPQVDAAPVADNLVSGVSSLLISTNSR